MPDVATLGHRLRALRAASGRTVASVAAQAGLSVPYIANLENGRGNPTVAALDRLAAALGTGLQISLVPAAAAAAPVPADMPSSLVRLGRSARFQHDARLLADALGMDQRDLSVSLIAALSGRGGLLGADPGEAGWHRLLDALLLIVLHPASG
jgi:transcriptional regulator with XRE-family HTH domain